MPSNDNDWKLREAARIENEYYKRLPWASYVYAPARGSNRPALSSITYHYAHISRKNPELLAYTENEDKGRRDIQSVIKPGKYLKKYYPSMSSDDIAYYSAIFKRGASLLSTEQKDEMLLARTEDEIENVYTSGPNSCMSYPAGNYPTDGYHPVRGYAAGDLAVAYIAKPGTMRVSARCVVWPDKKIMSSRIYGDGGAYNDTLLEMLTNAGYEIGEFEGAKLLKHKKDEYSNKLVIPYVDGQCSFAVEKEGFLVVCSQEKLPKPGTPEADSVWSTKYSNGLSPRMLLMVPVRVGDGVRIIADVDFDDDEDGYECASCGDRYTDGGTDTLCQDCYDQNYTWCISCEENVHNDYIMYIESGRRRRSGDICDNCRARETFSCSDCGELRWNDENSTEDVDGKNTSENPICDTCLEEHYEQCPECGVYYEELVKIYNDEELCVNCVEAKAKEEAV